MPAPYERREIQFEARLPCFEARSARAAFPGVGRDRGDYDYWVLVYAHSIRETGFRTAFDTVVRGFDGEFQSEAGLRPQPGDRIVRLGADKVETWSHFLRAVRTLPSQSWLEAADLSSADASYRRVAGDDWVFTELERPGIGSELSTRYAGWTKVGALPLRELTPSILWFFLKLGLFAVAALAGAAAAPLGNWAKRYGILSSP